MHKVWIFLCQLLQVGPMSIINCIIITLFLQTWLLFIVIATNLFHVENIYLSCSVLSRHWIVVGGLGIKKRLFYSTANDFYTQNTQFSMFFPLVWWTVYQSAGYGRPAPPTVGRVLIVYDVKLKSGSVSQVNHIHSKLNWTHDTHRDIHPVLQ